MMNEHLAAGYAASEPDRERAKRKLRAAAFHFSEDMEWKARMRDEQPEHFDRLPPTTRAALGYYANDKAAAEAEGIDTSRA